MTMHGLRVPVVLSSRYSGDAAAQVALLRVTAATTRPDSAYSLHDSSPIEGLCRSVERGAVWEHGEDAAECWVLARNKHYARSAAALQGRSADLGRALTALAAHEGTPLRWPVLATGALHNPLVDPEPGEGTQRLAQLAVSADAVLAVDFVEEKLAAMADWAAANAPEARLLLPACQAPEGEDSPRRVSQAALEEARRRLPEGEVLFVTSLSEAANAVLEVDPANRYGSSRIARLRRALWRLIYDAREVARLLQKADELRGLLPAADAARPQGPVALAGRLHALVAARFAATKLGRDAPTDPLRWHGEPWSPAALVPALTQEIDQLLKENSPPPHALRELVAHSKNLDATIGFIDLDFDRAVNLCTEGLAVGALLDGAVGERRKLLGTRAQFVWRQALRLHAMGAPGMAAAPLRQALDDVTVAWQAAQDPEVAACNDRARVTVYRVVAHLTARALGTEPWPADEHDPELELLDELLGPFGRDPNAPQAPQQCPTWGLHALYTAWALQDQWEALLAHWGRVASLTNPFGTTGPWTLDQSVFGPFPAGSRRLPSADHLLRLLAEAATHLLEAEPPQQTGARTLLDRCLAQAPGAASPPPLPLLARWLPAAGDRARAWLTEIDRIDVPQIIRGSGLTRLLTDLKADPSKPDLQRDLRWWVGITR